MHRLIIHVHDGTSDQDALLKVEAVVRAGKISGDGNCYCYLSRFPDDTAVSCDRSKTGFTFRVLKYENRN